MKGEEILQGRVLSVKCFPRSLICRRTSTELLITMVSPEPPASSPGSIAVSLGAVLSQPAFTPCFEGKEQESASITTKGCSNIANKLTDKPCDTTGKYTCRRKTQDKDYGTAQHTSPHRTSCLHVLLETLLHHIKNNNNNKSYSTSTHSNSVWILQVFFFPPHLREEKFNMANFKMEENHSVLGS